MRDITAIEPQVAFVEVLSQSTNDMNKYLQVLMDVVVLGYRSTSTIKDCEVEYSTTND